MEKDDEEEKKKTPKIVEEPDNRLHEKQKNGRRYLGSGMDRRFLANRS